MPGNGAPKALTSVLVFSTLVAAHASRGDGTGRVDSSRLSVLARRSLSKNALLIAPWGGPPGQAPTLRPANSPKVRAVAARLAREAPELIVHALRELPEKLGVLVLVIVKDPAGYELCLVSAETSALRSRYVRYADSVQMALSEFIFDGRGIIIFARNRPKSMLIS